MMKKKHLKWRLSDLPTGDDVARLVEEKIITPEEARQMLFNEDEEDGNKVAALKEEIKFLRELVDKLASKHNGWTTIYHEYRDYRPRYPIWYSGYSTVMNSLKATGSTNAVYAVTANPITGSTGVLTATSSSSSMKGLSSLN